MMTSVLLESPLLLWGVGVVLLVSLFDLRHHSTGMLLPALALMVGTTLIWYALYLGADLDEAAFVCMILLSVHLQSFQKRNQER